MAASNINRVIITGNLTADPDLRQTAGGMAICKLRVAVNTRRKDGSGNWVDKPNYFDVTVFGSQGENAARFLSKGRPVAIDGRLEWQEWQDKETGKNRSSVSIIADSVQFLEAPAEGRDGRFMPSGDIPWGRIPNSMGPTVPPKESWPRSAPVAAADDIPF